MKEYPIYIPRKTYKGSNASLKKKHDEYNRIAKELEAFLNKEIEQSNQETQIYKYGDISFATGISEQIVLELLFSVDCGHNGITIHKSKANN